MELDLEQIEKAFALYSGEPLTEETTRTELCRQLCGECKAMAEGLAGETETTAPLISWAAAEAFYQLALRDMAVAPEIVTADGVRVDAKERARHAESLARAKRQAAAPLLREEGFCFEHI